MTDEDEFDPERVVELPIDGVLDLHTFQPREVKDLVSDYLDECRRRGILEVRIVHGKGIGELRRIVHAVLERRDDVVHFALAPADRGGWGATLVTLSPLPSPPDGARQK
jgi:dsDNA-specific endonuclease/ATPase MutS2